MAKMFGHRLKKSSKSHEMDEDSSESRRGEPTKNYEGKEHVKYKNPGYSKHNIRYPEDEPHMKSHVSTNEMHEAEDNYHMGVPDQTEDTLPKKIKRARMKMDAPDQEDPKPLLGNLTTEIPLRGTEDEDGEEEEGPNYMQEDSGMPKSHRKKMIVAVMRRKMKSRDPGSPPKRTNNMVAESY